MDPRRLENEDEEKFWEAWIKDDLIFCYRFGKIGSPGGTKLKKFKTAAEAQAELEEKLEQKLAEGFAEIGAEGAEGEEDEEEKEEEDGEDEAKDEDEEEGEEEDDAKPSEAPPPPPPPPRPTLPTRVRPPAHPVTPKDIDFARERLVAVARSIGGRSWWVRRRARTARRALERLGGLDPQANASLAPVFADLMAEVIAPKKRLPLELALGLLWEVDAGAAAKTVSGWRAKMLSSPASTAIGVLAATFDAVPDPEVALHTGAALVERHLPAPAWKRRFAKVVPFLEESLATKGSSVERFLGGLQPDGDAIVKARVAAAAGVKGSVKLEPVVSAAAPGGRKAGKKR
ncbi:MAG: WGR domain-containing protein [Polyangiaceae bacterium]